MTYRQAMNELKVNLEELANLLGVKPTYIRTGKLTREMTVKNSVKVQELLSSHVAVKIGDMAMINGKYFPDGFGRAGEIKEEKGDLYIDLTHSKLFLSSIPFSDRNLITIFNKLEPTHMMY